MQRTIDDELRDLERRAAAIPFFALVNRLARLLPGTALVGGVGAPSAEPIRFRHDVRLVFHRSDVSELQIVRTGARLAVEMTTAFLGIVGSVSPLANYFSEDILRAESSDDHTLRDFYDVFHHRLIGFVYLAQRRAAPWCQIRTDGADRTSARCLALVGQLPRFREEPPPEPSIEGHDDSPLPSRRTEIGQARAPLSIRQELALCRTFVRHSGGRDGLEAALALAFPDVPMTVVDFLARDIRLDDSERTQVGVDNATLGGGARLGRHLPAQTGLLRVLVGPVDRATYEAFLPGGPSYPKLAQIVGSLTGGMLDCDAEIEIRCGDEPRARLGSAHGTRLGVTALVGRPRVDRAVRVRVSVSGGAAERAVFLAAPQS